MIIRPATSADIRAIAEVHVAAWQAAYRGLIPDSYVDEFTVEKRIELWQRRFSRPGATSMLVAEDRGAVIGFCLSGPTRDDDGKDKPIGELMTLNVRPDRWRSGVGKALCDAAQSEATQRRWTLMTLWILKGNERAGRFYEAMGFAFDGTERIDEHIVGVPVYDLRYRKTL